MRINLWLSVAVAISAALPASAVTLKMDDGSEVTGELIEYTPNGYRIRFKSLGKEVVIPDKGVTCQGSDCPYQTGSSKQANATAMVDTSVNIVGSNTIGAELMPRIISAYGRSLGTDVRSSAGASTEEKVLVLSKPTFEQTVNIKAHGSSTAFKALADGSADIGMASRAAKDKEINFLSSTRGVSNIRAHGYENVLGLDGLVIIVSPDNPINEINLNDLRQIFSGQITNWAEIGGHNAPISIYARDDKSGTFDTFKSLIMDGDSISGQAKRFESNESLSDSVANDSRSIGFTGFAYVRNAKVLPLVADCGIVSPATEFGVKSEEYPLSRRLYLYVDKNHLSSPASSILNYALSDNAQQVIKQSGFIDQSIEWRDASEMGQRFAHAATADTDSEYQALLRQFYQVVNRGQRLSSTFRFESGSFDLDVKARQDVARLARYIQNNPQRFNGKTLYLVGYADSVGTFADNLTLSANRAKAVANVLQPLLSYSGPTVEQVAFSEVAPVACNSSSAGRHNNRRVEVWIK